MSRNAGGGFIEHCIGKVHSDDLSAGTHLFLQEREIESCSAAEIHHRFTGTEENKAALASGVPLGRIGTPDEIARMIVFLGSDAASFLTGQIVTVDGGKTAG